MSSKAFGWFCRILVLCVIGLAVDSYAAGHETRQTIETSIGNALILETYAKWAAYLREMNDETKAAEVETRAKKLEQAFRAPLSTYLGFDPSEDLKAYADMLPRDAPDIYYRADVYRVRQIRNVKSHGAKVWDRFRYYAPK